MMGDELWF